jgi:iron complex transport system permease protein
LNRGSAVTVGVLAVIAAALTASAVGAVPLDLGTIASIGGSWLGFEGGHTPQQAAVLTQIRLPRVALGLLCGGTLGLCGAVLQGLFRNPLADPGLLGITSGAGLAVSLVVVVFPAFRAAFGPWALPLAAFAGSLAAAALVWLLAKKASREPTSALLLAGIAVTAVAGAGTGLLIALARDAELRDLTFWSLGSLGGVTWGPLLAALPFLLLPLPLIPWMARHLDALLLGERDAQALGSPVERIRVVSLMLTAGAVGAATALAGSVGFVGLVAAHVARMFVGHGHKLVLPLSALFGATLTVTADTVGRTLLAPAELPLGIVLAFVGAPFLIHLLFGARRPS